MAQTEQIAISAGDDLLLPSAAARLVGVSAAAVRTWICSGRLPCVRLSGGWRAIRRADLEAFVAERVAKAGAGR